MKGKRNLISLFLLVFILFSPFVLFYLLFPLKKITSFFFLIYLLLDFIFLILLIFLNFTYLCKDCFKSFVKLKRGRKRISCPRCRGYNIERKEFFSLEEFFDYDED